jgi:long-subunit fatty acid transport protein
MEHYMNDVGAGILLVLSTASSAQAGRLYLYELANPDPGPGLEALLRAKGLLDAELEVKFTMPQALMFSAYHDLTDRWAIMGNLGWQEWSEFDKVGVAVTSADTSSLTIDRNYKDTWHVAVGAHYRVAAPWREGFRVLMRTRQ